jgi:alginate O-acetyltransferase complex protein AlgI
MSLYRWLIDYVFIPLGGSRGSRLSVCRNVMFVMLLSGVWHGAGLNFVVWGAWHGLLLVVHRLWSGGRGAERPPPTVAGKFVAWLLTYVSVNLGWAFFAMDLETAAYFFQRLFVG